MINFSPVWGMQERLATRRPSVVVTPTFRFVIGGQALLTKGPVGAAWAIRIDQREEIRGGQGCWSGQRPRLRRGSRSAFLVH
jgi:hypothetical protein